MVQGEGGRQGDGQLLHLHARPAGEGEEADQAQAAGNQRAGQSDISLFLDGVASVVLTCVSNRLTHSLTKTQASSFTVAFMRLPHPKGILPCCSTLDIGETGKILVLV